MKEFGEALGAYPIPEDTPVVARWGYHYQGHDELILRIEIARANTRGDLIVRFEIADQDEPSERVRGSFLTNYPDVDAFKSAIAALMSNEAGEAVLKGR